ncbi:helix-turn-helix transcriptional regulator [Paenibacillus sp. CAU 1523]|uniref:Helix-turn-helix transcriptional regulator n=2 Tax=Paenibacillus arenosi TaxID=2774142 RepID=A0ABR9B444_9BACL|nr:AraC family transcriptional regulator [Paenibacillus arenosi]MBD8501148.1 helix-turn-helix transcriptional regulator [Paenibacillus arenosi]
MVSRHLDDAYDGADFHTMFTRHSEQDRYLMPSHLGEGSIQRIPLRRGMELVWFDTAISNDIQLDFDVQYPHLEISYTFSGKGVYEPAAQAHALQLTSGVSSLTYMDGTRVYAELSPEEHIRHMELRLDLNALNMILPELDRIKQHSFFSQQLAGIPDIPILIEQMQNCSYQGSLRKLFLEGKSLELLAFHLSRLDDNPSELNMMKSKLNADDIERLYKAKEILDHTWKQPPTLCELARMAYLNDYKLKLGFKELFGTTVFGYVRALRMNQARMILEQGSVNISEASTMVGYSNMSHFSSLYKKTFGYNPSECGKR